MLNQVKQQILCWSPVQSSTIDDFGEHEEFGKGRGVTWEGGVIIQELYDAQGQNSKFIPITFTPEDSTLFPVLSAAQPTTG